MGYWANRQAFKAAIESGADHFGAAQTPAAMDAVVRNTAVQGTLSIVFVLLTIVVVVMALLEVLRAWRGHQKVSHENPYVESKNFAPAGLTATPAEKELEKECAEFYRKHPEEIAGSAEHAAH